MKGKDKESGKVGQQEKPVLHQHTVLMSTNNAEAIYQNTRAPEKFQASSS